MAESGDVYIDHEVREQELLKRIELLNHEKFELAQKLSMAKAARDVAESQVEDLQHTKEIMAAKLEMVYLIFGRDAK